MLHREFAINPDQVQSLADLRLLEARFGYDKGALISAFPKRWYSAVASHLISQASPLKVDELSDALKALKANALASFSREFKVEQWFEAAKDSHENTPFHRIVDQSHDNPPLVVASINNLRGDDFSVQPQVLQTAESLASAGVALLLSAEKVTLFDPYICVSKAGSRKTLLAMMTFCQKPKVRFHVFAEADKPNWNTCLKPALFRFAQEIPDNIELNWYLVDDRESGYVHSRGFFTAKGGLIYDRGFSEPSEHHKRKVPTDVHFMSSTTLTQKARDYNEAQLSEHIYLVHRWSSNYRKR